VEFAANRAAGLIISRLSSDGAQGETRTPMPLRALRPEHSVSTNFTTWAGRGKGIICRGMMKGNYRLQQVA